MYGIGNSCVLTDRLPINRDAALIIFNMHPTKQVHADNQLHKYQSYRYYKLNNKNTNPPPAMRNAPSSFRQLACARRLVGRERLVRQHGSFLERN